MFGVFRLFLAFNVVAFHILSVPSIGPFAVYSFFILSGLLMTTIMHNTYGYSFSGFKKYAMNRFLRLYPVYWSLLLVAVAMMFFVGNSFYSAFHTRINMPQNISEWLANLTMIYPDYNPVNYPVRLAPATWALTIEIFYYLLIGLGLSKNKWISTLWFSLSLGYVIFNVIMGRFTAGYGNVTSASLPFSIGAMIYWYKDEIMVVIRRISPAYFLIFTTLFILNLVVITIAQILFPEEAWKFGTVGTYANLFLTTFLIVILLEDGRRFVSKKVDKIMGDLSYPVYIFHWSAAAFASWLIYDDVRKGFNIDGLMVFLLGCVITILVSLIVNKFVNDQIEVIRQNVKSSN